MGVAQGGVHRQLPGSCHRLQQAGQRGQRLVVGTEGLPEHSDALGGWGRAAYMHVYMCELTVFVMAGCDWCRTCNAGVGAVEVPVMLATSAAETRGAAPQCLEFSLISGGSVGHAMMCSPTATSPAVGTPPGDHVTHLAVMDIGCDDVAVLNCIFRMKLVILSTVKFLT